MDQRDNDLVDEGSPSPTLGSARPKRRSLLPQPGTPKIPVRSIAFSDTTMERVNNTQLSAGASEIPKPTGAIPLARGTSVTGSRLGRLRPRSMYQTGTAPTEKGNEVEKPTSTRSMQPPSLPSKSSAVPSLGLGRTQSLRRPAVTAQPTPSSSTTAHSRTQSTSTVPLARSNTTRPRSTAERPKSVHMPSTSAAQANSGSIQPEPAITRTSTRLAGLSRSASVRTKPDGPSVGLRPLAPAPTRPKVPTKEEPKKVPRPAFSTLQQHFTPRKESKAPTSTFLHPAPITASNSLPPELVSLQLDLLQLHLLHENAEEVSRQWEASAKRQLRLKFDEVASMYQAMLEHERSGQEQKNLQALLEWTGAKASASLVEHIQVLSGPLHELPSLVQTGGRFQRHVAAFEQWISWAEEVRSARDSRKEGGLGSIEGLGDAWKAENAALMRKLTSFSRDLGGLSQPAAGSSIALIIGNCESLLDGLLEELRVMQGIEADVVSKEKEWVETRLQGIAADIGSFLVDDEAPAWRM